ncbi:MAG TPA: dihydroorotate dehydrogenase-like protein [Bryobacteraceae bacterium]|nr:dihydroorotate dehydrogenase-like protein [Bryobacteraceae bacterium]
MDLTTKYLGLNLKNPLVVSASPLSEHLGNIKKMEQAGAAAVVMHSLFEEQIEQDGEALDRSLSTGGSAEAASYFPNVDSYRIGPETYLENLAKAKASVKIPIIASLNGASSGGWTDYAKKMQQAGADAIELNIYTIPTDPRVNAAEIEQRYCDLVKDVKASVQIPVAVKLCPYFSAMVNMAMQLEQAGADGLVLFNRFYQPDFDLEALEVVPSLQLSTPYELLLRLHWVAILHGRVRPDLAITGGVHSSYDVLKAMMAGAQVTMMASAILKRGIDYIATVLGELQTWMEEHEYESIKQMQGSMSQKSVADPKSFLRGNYLKVLSSYALRA